MHQSKGKKVFLYFFLLLLLGSINNINLIEANFLKIKVINVNGLDKYENEILSKKIKSFDFENIFFLNRDKLNILIKDNSLVENFRIFKKYPSTIKVKLQKTNFLAKINKDGKLFIVGSNGKLSKINYSKKKLPFIFGKPTTDEFLKFKHMLDKSNFDYKKIENLFFFPSKRWDLELTNKIIIKLPKYMVNEALKNAYNIINDKEFNNIKVIDLRIKNQIILND